MSLRAQLFDAFASRPRPAASAVVRDEGGEDAARVRYALEEMAVSDVSVHEANSVFEGNLWLLTPGAFLYYLPALMHLTVSRYESVSVVASELVSALTKPSRSDVLASLERLAQLPPEVAPAPADALREQQLDWFDSGSPSRAFHERFDDLQASEGRAVLAFLRTFKHEHGADFPFGELDAAIERHWAQYEREGPGTMADS